MVHPSKCTACRVSGDALQARGRQVAHADLSDQGQMVYVPGNVRTIVVTPPTAHCCHQTRGGMSINTVVPLNPVPFMPPTGLTAGAGDHTARACRLREAEDVSEPATGNVSSQPDGTGSAPGRELACMVSLRAHGKAYRCAHAMRGDLSR